MMKVKSYDLPDVSLIEETRSDYRCLVWNPHYLCVVLGNSNTINDSIHIIPVLKDNLPVYKRPTGGETVLLSPNTLAVSIVKCGEHMRFGKRYFHFFNERIIHALESAGVKGLNQRGFSDIAIADQKLVGSAIYQNKDRILFQAVLNISESGSIMEKYIKHPLREPDYRGGRSHKNFVTSLKDQGYYFDISWIKRTLENEFSFL